MAIVKKLLFAPLFLLTFLMFCYQLNLYIQDPSAVISFSSDALNQLVILSLLILASGLFFTILVTLSKNPKFVLPVIILGSLAPLPFTPFPLSFMLSAGFLLIFGLVFFLLEKKLENYLTFQANNLLIPSIKQVVTLTLIISSLLFYISSSQQIAQDGFQIPDSIIDMSLKLAPSEADIAKQYGLDPSMLDTVSQPQSKTPAKIDTQTLLKPMIKSQIQNMVKPYEQYIPLILTILFFITLQSTAFLIAIILPLLVWFIFYILEKTGFTKFEVEMREVKKLVV